MTLEASAAYGLLWVNSRHCTYRVRPSEISLLNIFSAFAGCTRAPWTIEHGCAGGTELLFVVGKAKGHAPHIWNSACAEPHRIRRAGICILLSIGSCWQGCRDHDRIMTKATAHNLRMTLHSNFGLGVATITVGVCSASLRRCQPRLIRSQAGLLNNTRRLGCGVTQHSCIGKMSFEQRQCLLRKRRKPDRSGHQPGFL